MNYILIFLAGGLGSLLRYAIGGVLPSSFFPWTTVGINVLGSFSIGLFGGLGARMGWSDNLQLALTVGLCGGFTTFSTFSKEALSLAAAGRWGAFSLYVIGSVVLGLAATAVGFMCSRGWKNVDIVCKWSLIKVNATTLVVFALMKDGWNGD